ncbi:hypothetical protein ABT030_29020 [Streptomyces mirabilis]
MEEGGLAAGKSTAAACDGWIVFEDEPARVFTRDTEPLPPITVFVARQRGHRPSRDVIDTSDIDVHLGLDVDKGEHHATALTP